jgi:hypothetical protein
MYAGSSSGQSMVRIINPDEHIGSELLVSHETIHRDMLATVAANISGSFPSNDDNTARGPKWMSHFLLTVPSILRMIRSWMQTLLPASSMAFSPSEMPAAQDRMGEASSKLA